MSIFSIGLSGLRAAQAGLYATSNNISNVNTDGYNRELVNLSENRMHGVEVDGITRQFNQFVATRLNAASGSYESLETYYSQVRQIDNVLSDERSGLNAVMEKFFGALSQFAGNPADPSAREGVLGTASTLTAQFRSFDSYLRDIETSVNSQVKFEVDAINTLTGQVASLNEEILMARAVSGVAPNSLLNQRDQIVHELSQKMDVRVYEQKSGSYTLSLSNGSPLVSGDRVYQLETVTDPADPSRVSIMYNDVAGNPVPLKESVFSRGAVAGLLEFRAQSLDKMRDQLGQLVVAFASAFNEQHMAGTDLNQQPGQAMFSLGQTVTNTNLQNAGTATATTTITDPQALLATGYDIKQTATGIEVTRLDNGKQVAATFNAGTNTLSFNGLEVAFDAGTLVDGDRFRVNPLREQAANFDLLLTEGSELAAAQSNASGDNRNALALSQLQGNLIVEGNATLSQAYGAMISSLGNQINVVQANMAAQQGLTEQLEGLQQSESGVNLDEEAANLIRYQQYYQANAKVIETGSTLLDTILSLR